MDKQTIKLKSLKNIEDNCVYHGCVFYLSESKNYQPQHVQFHDCSFRTNVTFGKLDTCVFRNCSFAGDVVVDLRSSEIKEIPEWLFQIPMLTQLDLSCNYDLFLEGISKFHRLTHLTLYSCGLADLPQEMSELQNLTYLSLNTNNFRELPKVVYQLHSLTRLELAFNEISLTEEIQQLKKLTYLDISRSNLREFPTTVCQLPTITHLDLSFNKISKIPPQIGDLQHLVFLDLIYNEIGGLPSEIGKLHLLKELKLQRNSLKNLPSQMSHLTSLQSIDLSRTSIVDDSLMHLTDSVEKIDLSHTAITNKAFSYLDNLEKLSDVDVKFTGINREGLHSFNNISKLNSLHLAGLKITPAELALFEEHGINTQLSCVEIDTDELTTADYEKFMAKKNVPIMSWWRTAQNTAFIVGGDYIDGGNVHELHSSFHCILNSGIANVIFDLTTMKYMNDTGLAEFVQRAGDIQSQGENFSLVNVPERIRSLFDMLGLLDFFHFPDAESCN